MEEVNGLAELYLDELRFREGMFWLVEDDRLRSR
jgi:hypothetical protein